MRAIHKNRPLPWLPGLWLLLPLLLLAPAAWAQTPPDADSSDAGELPDASVGEGGAERDNPEGEDSTGRVQLDCRTTDRCAPGFQCVRGECEWTGIRDAEGPSCALGSALSSLLLLAGFLLRRG